MVGIQKKIKQIILISFILLAAKACVPLQPTTGSGSVAQNFPTLKFINTTYSGNIGTVQLASFKNGQFISSKNAVIGLDKNESLQLSFDDITSQQQLYQAKIFHLNKDWTQKSNLLPMDFLSDYNQFSIRDFEYSFDTKMPYVHYTLEVPPVKISGNYLLVVYRGNNEDDIVLSERFMVYEDKAGIAYEIVPSNVVSQRRTHQELRFEVLLNRVNILNAGSDIYPVIRQNSNWLHAIQPKEPMRITDQNQKLVYEFYNGELNFPGVNEFRFIDLTTVNFKGSNVININKDAKPITALAGVDKNRSHQAYREWNDRNGAFIIGNRERQTNELVTDYFETTFQLEAPQQQEDIYIVGEFNNWEINHKSRMKFDPTKGRYTNSYLLKQGYYEYLYYTANSPHYELEGNYVDTENEYDISVYYANPQLRYDQLIGYVRFNSRAAR
ncbi:DUF5103 domain-containing protein [Marivirga sp. S37H4]|uniref:DUF5103 domain-containing protein n=1 Tax=Marivirga aurantiaca TaxID=2802615 RepID=A0A934WV84_9BACT|nr:type IX secretion system plug protein domain-containing protein [Marivirga aurantiaca]MBK6263557.1 DUF5103 domain-containing protein [Marivirga aurantiaca]